MVNASSSKSFLPVKDSSSCDTSVSSKTMSMQHQSGFAFKCFIIIQMIIIWSSYTIIVRYTRSRTPEYLCINEHYFTKPKDLLKMSFPSIAYTLQNNLDFVALSNLDAGVYHISTQLKVVSTAVFMMIVLKKRYSSVRWFAIILLFGGVAAVQVSVNDGSKTKSGENYVVGIVAVLLTCITAGFAGVYFEWMLKDGSETPFWIRNLQMYSCGAISAALGCIISEWERITSRGFFYGYNVKVIAIILSLSLGGIFISLVMKYLDNLCKSFASAVSIILVVIVSYLVFNDMKPNIIFILGSVTVCGAILLYSSAQS